VCFDSCGYSEWRPRRFSSGETPEILVASDHVLPSSISRRDVVHRALKLILTCRVIFHAILDCSICQELLTDPLTDPLCTRLLDAFSRTETYHHRNFEKNDLPSRHLSAGG
jgi:hypothetical protein